MELLVVAVAGALVGACIVLIVRRRRDRLARLRGRYITHWWDG